MKYVYYVAIAILFLIVTSCNKADKRVNWVHLDGYQFPVNMSHFADYVNTDEPGNVLGHVKYGANGDDNDWKLIEYTGEISDSKGFITGINLPESTIGDITPLSTGIKGIIRTDSKVEVWDGFIYPGEPVSVDPDTLGPLGAFVISTPSLEEVTTTPVLQYCLFPGSTFPVELKAKNSVYASNFGITLKAPLQTDHTRLSVQVPEGVWYALAYYNGTWNEPTEFPVSNSSALIWNDIPFTEYVDIIFNKDVDPFLPPYMFSFTGEWISNFKVMLRWADYPDELLTGYNILRSNNNNLADAEMINPSPVTIGEAQDEGILYTFIDENVESDQCYYWLQKTRQDSEPSYYGPVFVTVNQVGPPNWNSITPAYPNPSDGLFVLRYTLRNSYTPQDSAEVNILIINEQYQVVRNYEYHKNPGSYHVLVDISDMPEGLYRVYYWIKTEGKNYYSYGDVLKKSFTK